MLAIKRLAVAWLVLLLQGCDTNFEMTAQERGLLITAAEFAPYVDGSHDRTRGRFKKELNVLTGSRDLSYDFEFREDAKEPPLFVSCTISIEPRLLKPYGRATRKIGAALGFALGKLKQEPLQGFPTYGDRSSIHLLTLDDRPVGNLFIAEYGRKSVTLILTGVYVRDPAVWQEILEKKLRLLADYEEPEPRARK